MLLFLVINAEHIVLHLYRVKKDLLVPLVEMASKVQLVSRAQPDLRDHLERMVTRCSNLFLPFAAEKVSYLGACIMMLQTELILSL